MKLILTTFEQLSGLNINFHKSELFFYGDTEGAKQEYMNSFGCLIAKAKFHYLGIRMYHTRLHNKNRKMMEDRFERKLSIWKSKMLSYGGRLTLINSVLSNMSMYMFLFFEIPREVLKRLYYFRSRFFWQGDGHKQKYRLTKWNVLCRPKEQGGLGILDLEIQNKCLLCK